MLSVSIHQLKTQHSGRKRLHNQGIESANSNMTVLLRLFLTTSLATTLINAELFDVTTIYRLPETSEKHQDKANVRVPNCYVESDYCNWSVFGFTEKRDPTWHLDLSESFLSMALSQKPSGRMIHQFPAPSKWTRPEDLRTRHLVCLQMEAYIKPDSDGSISLSAVQANNTQLLGTLRSTSSDKAETWKFASVFDLDPALSWQLVISAENTVTIFNVSSCRDQDIDRVVLNPATTADIHGRTNARGLPFTANNAPTRVMKGVVFNPATTADIHGRTNARGLPLKSNDAVEKGVSLGGEFAECSCANDGCDWTMDNWSMMDTGLIDAKPKLLIVSERREVFNLSAGVNTKPAKFYGSLRFTSDIYDFKLSLSDAEGVRYYFRFVESGDVLYDVYFYKCSAQTSCANYYEKTMTYRGNDYRNYASTKRLRIVLGITSSSIALTVDCPTNSMSTYHHTYDNLKLSDITSFTLHSDTRAGRITRILDEPVLALTEVSGSLMSPWFLPHGDEVCVSLEVYVEDGKIVPVTQVSELETTDYYDNDEDVSSTQPSTQLPPVELENITSTIQLALEASNGSTKITTLQVSESEKGKWSRHRVMLALPGGSRGQKVRVIATGRKDGGKLLVQRIASCSAEGDIRVLRGDSATSNPRSFDVAQIGASHELMDDTRCLNGAKLDSALGQCACPAGFTGSACSEGCGWNRYGDDCGGECSITMRGCRSMYMCRPRLGCYCAPGYTGLLCDTECASGQYGASCKQSCGLCAGEPCDIYTGICHQGCKDGSYPPFCKELYKYLGVAPQVKTQGFNGADVSADLFNLLGQGHPVSLQLQFKEEDKGEWMSKTPLRILETESTSTEVGHLTGLRSGNRYQVRVVLIDITGKSYDGELVPVTTFSSDCVVPDTHDYELRSSYQWRNGINVTWTYPTTIATWCPLLYHEVLLLAGWQQLESRIPAGVETAASFSYLQPGVEYLVQVTAVTNKGRAVSSPRLKVRTTDEVPDHVTALHVTLGQGRSLEVSWKPPRRPAGVMKNYQISYQCLHLLACPGATCSDSQGQLEVVATSSVISWLQPHAVYKISVAGVSGSVGPSTATLAATASQLPDATPASSTRPVSNRSNSSLTVNWEPPSAANCSDLNGYLLGYRYELTKPSQLAPMLEASTTNTSATFDNLEPLTQYIVKVYVVTEDGWNSGHALEIPAKTRATTPSPVRDLVVYARERRRVSLRWREPSLMYGALQSFTVSVARGDVTPVSVTVKPQRCVAWPNLFCHTVKDLLIDTSYVIRIQARNAEVAEDGEEATISAQTKEAAPEAPSFARVVNLTTDSATIEWGIPDMINGKLRSFLISIEETDAANSSQCCQNFPMKEMAVLGEEGIRSTYQIKMSDLKPATTYALSVSAKTVGLGPPVSLTIQTRPEAPVIEPPRLLLPANQETGLRVTLTPYQPDELVSRYMLFMEGSSSDKEPRNQIADLWLADQINSMTNQSLSLVAEYTKASLPSDNTLLIAMQDRRPDGSTSTESVKNNHRLLLALVLDYCGSVGVGFAWSAERFTFPDPANDV